jgi:ethanolamine utilization protein EutN
MRLGRVTGRLWSTIKNEALEGRRFLVVRPIDGAGCDAGEEFVALDSIGAGAGEIVYWVRGREACIPFYPDQLASDATVVGIVDRVEIAEAGARP